MSAKDQRRIAVWRHNSFIGTARRMETGAQAIYNASTTSPTAKQLAREIAALADALQTNLRKERIDTDV